MPNPDQPLERVWSDRVSAGVKRGWDHSLTAAACVALSPVVCAVAPVASSSAASAATMHTACDAITDVWAMCKRRWSGWRAGDYL